MKALRIVRRLLLDLALWYCAPILFLLLYVRSFSEPVASVEPHLSVIALPLLALWVFRILLHRYARGSLIAAALPTSILLALLLLYYAIVLVGLASWGGVVAWNVIPTFFSQASVMTDAVGISPAVAICGLVVAYVGLAAACWSYLRRFNWASELANSLSGATLSLLVAGALAVIGLEAYEFSLGSWTAQSEPLSLTLLPPKAAFDLEGYSVNPLTAARLDRAEDAARRAYRPMPGEHGNLVLIIVDALRPDHMGIYGYPRDTTPNLMRIASERPVRIVRDVHASCGDTICAMFSLFSSKFPREFSFRPFTLQDVLRLNGYRVHMILSGDHTFFYSLKGFYGHVDTFYDGTQAKGYFLNDDRLVLDRLARMPDWDGHPAMFQFHLMSAHILRKQDSAPGPYQPAARYVFRQARDTGPGSQSVQSAINFYDNGVVGADQIIDRLLKLLQAKGYLRNGLVVITADHGESLGEHGLYHHANSVREELLRVPLILIPYGCRPRWEGSQRAFPSQVDIAPTVLAEFGLPRPASWSGRPLQQPDAPEFSYFTEQAFVGLLDRGEPPHAWKYWIDTSTGTDHVFDLNLDPHEDHDLRKEVSRERLAQWRARTLSATSAAVVQR